MSRGDGVGLARRDVLLGAAALGIAFFGRMRAVQAQPVLVAAAGEALRKIQEICSTDGRLRAELTVAVVDRTLPDRKQATRLRGLSGLDVVTGTVWPPPELAGVVLPGPTLRAQVGDFVEIKFFNQVDLTLFSPEGIDRGETGMLGGCETMTDGLAGKLIYPNNQDAFPNCFHASSTNNIHFHGLHVTPDGLGDNVLLKVRPAADLPKAEVGAFFETIFERTRLGDPPQHWTELPAGWTGMQLDLLAKHDEEAVWQGEPGNLPPESRLLPVVLAQVAAGLWPQYQIGAYPFSFQITEWKGSTETQAGHQHVAAVGPVAGQSPGTHWYHGHVHGSTAINLLNGMAGVFVIEGEAYDGTLRKLLPELTEHVLIVQQYGEYPWLYYGNSKFRPHVVVNGQNRPVIKMRPGEVRLWRLVNATVDAVASIGGFALPTGSPEIPLPQWNQTAQDGVQFSPDAYGARPFQQAGSLFKSFSPGNRVDLLVQAPPLPDNLESAEFDFILVHDPLMQPALDGTILKLSVGGTPMSMSMPSEEDFPAQLPFLYDLIDDPPPRISRTVIFQQPTRPATPRQAGPRIDGQEFEDGRYDQTMVLGDTEEWKLVNDSATAAHPFHIHVNPFQVVEIFDPNVVGDDNNPIPPVKIDVPVWQDTVAIPPKNPATGEAGYVKIRHRFDDFTGSFVLHCHILEHEDRGMMQLVRVIAPASLTRHH